MDIRETQPVTYVPGITDVPLMKFVILTEDLRDIRTSEQLSNHQSQG
jgi:hypothetical protein